MDKIGDLNKNILLWYPFKKDASILYLTEKKQDIKLYFPEKSSNVTVVKFCKDDIQTQEYYDEKVKTIEANFDKISLKENYD